MTTRIILLILAVTTLICATAIVCTLIQCNSVERRVILSR
jgi:hypothetical protein